MLTHDRSTVCLRLRGVLLNFGTYDLLQFNIISLLFCLQVRSLVRSTMDGVDKKLEAVAARVRKHLGHGPLFSMVWNTIKNQLLARWVAAGREG
jgi:hypothetical protein